MSQGVDVDVCCNDQYLGSHSVIIVDASPPSIPALPTSDLCHPVAKP